MDKYGVSLSEEDRNTFREAFGVSNTGDLTINVEKLVNYEKTQHIGKIYDQVNLEAEDEELEEENYKDFDAIASLGGIQASQTIKLNQIEESDILSILETDNKLPLIVRDTKKIDKDNNGYVLSNELTKIFKSHYQRDLEGKSLNRLFRQFSSIQNK